MSPEFYVIMKISQYLKDKIASQYMILKKLQRINTLLSTAPCDLKTARMYKKKSIINGNKHSKELKNASLRQSRGRKLKTR